MNDTETRLTKGMTMNTVIATREWTTATGRKVVASVSLDLTKTLWLDGDVVTVPCCEISIVSAAVEGFADQYGHDQLAAPREQDGNVYVAAIGKLGLTAETNAMVQSMIAEIKAHPAWIAKEAAAKQNRAEIDAMESRRARNGFCPKCHTYCHGDCES